MNIIQLVIGDQGGDGHDKREYISVECSHTIKEVNEAYEIGCEIVGFDIASDVATEYEDSNLPVNIRDLIIKGHYMDEDGHLVTDPDYWEDEFSTDEFARIYMWIVRKGNPEIEFKVIQMKSIDIGGYGMLC